MRNSVTTACIPTPCSAAAPPPVSNSFDLKYTGQNSKSTSLSNLKSDKIYYIFLLKEKMINTESFSNVYPSIPNIFWTVHMHVELFFNQSFIWWLFILLFVLLGFISHQHCKGLTMTFQLYMWRKISLIQMSFCARGLLSRTTNLL
jgi:hypothetical protein